MAKERVFGRLKRTLYRKEISVVENSVGMALALSLVGAGAWVALQKNNYDSTQRDLPLEYLKASTLQNVYKKPLQRWGQSTGVSAQIELGAFDAALLQDWSIARPLKRYVPDNLYEKINGQAEQYLKFGFTELQCISIQNAAGQIADLLLYHQGDFAGSLGVYAEQRSPEHEVLSQGALHYTPTSVGGFGIVGPYFFQMMIAGDSPSLDSARKHLIKGLANTKLEGQASLEALDKLLEAGARFADISYLPENVFQYGFATEFWFSKLNNGTDGLMFNHRSNSPEESMALLEQFKKVLPDDYNLVLEENGVYYYQHPFLKTYFALSSLGQNLCGLDEVPSLEMAKEIMLNKILKSNESGPTSTSTGEDDELPEE
jgi:hypothetical protein